MSFERTKCKQNMCRPYYMRLCQHVRKGKRHLQNAVQQTVTIQYYVAMLKLLRVSSAASDEKHT